jgi:tRNA-uridine 2-sulfurtransferase
VETVFIAMSGGLDSSFSAYLLKKQGFKVVGVTFALLPKGLTSAGNPKACCSLESVERARRTADALSIPHYVINLRPEFEEHVIERFISEYRSGRTPNPCVLCNKRIKFSSFLAKALALGADRIATGHYARVERSGSRQRLMKPRDRQKDQTYFLYPIRQDSLKHVLFPLADYTKATVRTEMSTFWQCAERVEESQDICFIPDNDYRGFIQKFVSLRKGDIQFVDGRHLGYHEGVHLYTIGQRRGLNIPFSEALYVIEIRPEENLLVVGPKEYLQRRRLIAGEINMFVETGSGRASAKVRYRHKEVACTYSASDGRLEVSFDTPVSAVTPGQSVVLYEKETVLGGGAILQSL